MSQQLTLNFDPVNHEQWESCREYLDDKVIPDYLREKGVLKKYLAADLGLSPSELRRKLAPGPSDKRNFSLDDLENWLSVTGDLRPLFYLLEKYTGDRESEIAELRARLAALEKPGQQKGKAS